ncbi:MAG: hypothetical protein AAF515_11295 [Pseudomonadota bacterium]
MRTTIRQLGLFMVAALLLVGCGGGGGGGGGNEPPSPPASGNSPPAFSGSTSFSFAENEFVQFTVSVSDPDGDTVTITDDTSGDGGLFTLNATTGTVTANTADGSFNFEMPLDNNADNVYEQTITLNDGTTSVSEVIRVTITNVIEPPRYQGSSNFEAGEGIIGTAISATDNDSSVLEFSLAGDDAAAFRLVPGGIEFVTAPDFEMPADADGDNVYRFDLSISNSDATITEALMFTITDVDEAPVCTSEAAFAFDENQAGQIYTFTFADPEGETFPFQNFSAFADALVFDSITFDELSGAVSLANAIDFESLTQTDGTVSVQVGETTCEASFTVSDVEGAVASGVRLRASGVAAAEALGDIDADGRPELWLTIQDDNRDDQSGLVVFSGALNAAMPAGSVDLTIEAAPEAVRITWSEPPIGVSRVMAARAVGDIDGDGRGELLLGFRDCGGCPTDRPLAYLIWGSTLTAPETSSLNIDALQAGQGLALMSATVSANGITGLAAADFDGDGRGDLAIAQPTPAERARIVFGDFIAAAQANASLDLDTALQTEALDLNLDYFDQPFIGEQLGVIGDLDGDGADELMLAATQLISLLYSSTIADGRIAGSLSVGFDYDAQTNVTNGVVAFNRRPFDVDADTVPDLLWTTPAGGLAEVAPGSQAPGGMSSKIVVDDSQISTSGGVTALGDLDGDAGDEFALTTRGLGPVSPVIRFVAGQALTPVALGFTYDLGSELPGDGLTINPVNDTRPLAGTLASPGDLDDDGLSEVVVISTASGEAYVIRGADVAAALAAEDTELSLDALFNQE